MKLTRKLTIYTSIIRRLCAVWLVLVISVSIQPATAAKNISAVKAAFIYNFIGFVDWPKSVPKKPFYVCSHGINDPVSPFLDTIIKKASQKRPLNFLRVTRDSPINKCHILFISETKKNDIDYMVGKVSNRPILTVSDIKGFAQKMGGVIGLVPQKSTVKIEVNLTTAKKLGLEIDSELLELVTIYR